MPRDKWVKSENIPDNAKRALVAIEDKRYYKHGAIDVLGVTRAFMLTALLVKPLRVVVLSHNNW